MYISQYMFQDEFITMYKLELIFWRLYVWNFTSINWLSLSDFEKLFENFRLGFIQTIDLLYGSSIAKTFDFRWYFRHFFFGGIDSGKNDCKILVVEFYGWQMISPELFQAGGSRLIGVIYEEKLQFRELLAQLIGIFR